MISNNLSILIGHAAKKQLAKGLYENSLNRLKLFPHTFKSEKDLISIKNSKLNYKLFWEGKSKGPYCWGRIENNSCPWIGFVGYEINYQGEIRVRKKIA